MTDEYDLSDAGAFSVTDLLEFQQSELEKGRTIRKIWITRLQANHLVNSIKGYRPKKTGMRLVDFWNLPRETVKLTNIHGIEIGVDDDHY